MKEETCLFVPHIRIFLVGFRRNGLFEVSRLPGRPALTQNQPIGILQMCSAILGFQRSGPACSMRPACFGSNHYECRCGCCCRQDLQDSLQDCFTDAQRKITAVIPVTNISSLFYNPRTASCSNLCFNGIFHSRFVLAEK